MSDGWIARSPLWLGQASRTMTPGEMLATRFPICSKPERVPASRPCALRTHQLRHGAGRRRALAAAHRGYRRGPLPAGVRDRDLPGSRLARARMGAAGAAAIRASRRLSSRVGAARRAQADLSELRDPRRDRAPSRRARVARALAARSGRRAALSGRRAADAGRPTRGDDRPWRALCDPARYGPRRRMDRAADLDRGRRRSGRPAWRGRGRARRLGRRHRRPQGDTDQLSPRSGDRRCRARPTDVVRGPDLFW